MNEPTRTPDQSYESLAKFTVEESDYVFIKVTNIKSGRMYFGLGLEPDAMSDGCDVTELDHITACKVLARLCGVYVYHTETAKSIADYSMEGRG